MLQVPVVVRECSESPRAASSPTSSPAGGSLLGGYESSDEADVTVKMYEVYSRILPCVLRSRPTQEDEGEQSP